MSPTVSGVVARLALSTFLPGLLLTACGYGTYVVDGPQAGMMLTGEQARQLSTCTVPNTATVMRVNIGQTPAVVSIDGRPIPNNAFILAVTAGEHQFTLADGTMGSFSAIEGHEYYAVPFLAADGQVSSAVMADRRSVTYNALRAGGYNTGSLNPDGSLPPCG